tara:strand:- start:804 stop:953 length:150 start_codon:yes stop_codon:yes gene_type:complete
MNQARATIELEKGVMDLFWTGVDKYTVSRLRGIPVPLDKGQMSVRRFII